MLFVCPIWSLIRCPSVEGATWGAISVAAGRLIDRRPPGAVTVQREREMSAVLWDRAAGCMFYRAGSAPRHTNSEFGHVFGGKHVGTPVVAKKRMIPPLFWYIFSTAYHFQGREALEQLLLSSQLNFNFWAFFAFGISPWHLTMTKLSKALNNFTFFEGTTIWDGFSCITKYCTSMDHLKNYLYVIPSFHNHVFPYY